MKKKSKYVLKTDICPVSGANTYTVFKNDVLIFMMDGDKVSMFKPEEVEIISIAESPKIKIYRVSNWVFPGSALLTRGIIKQLPKGCLLCPAIGKGSVLKKTE